MAMLKAVYFRFPVCQGKKTGIYSAHDVPDGRPGRLSVETHRAGPQDAVPERAGGIQELNVADTLDMPIQEAAVHSIPGLVVRIGRGGPVHITVIGGKVGPGQPGVVVPSAVTETQRRSIASAGGQMIRVN